MNDTTVWCQNASVTEPKREVAPERYGSFHMTTDAAQNFAKTYVVKGFGEGYRENLFGKRFSP